MKPSDRQRIYGVMAEFDDPDVAGRGGAAARAKQGYRDGRATRRSRSKSCTKRCGIHDRRLPLIVLIGGMVGLLGGYRAAVLGVGDRVPAERRRPAAAQLAGVHSRHVRVTILGAALSAVLGMLALNGLPQPYHPVFNVPRFALASRNRFFL